MDHLKVGSLSKSLSQLWQPYFLPHVGHIHKKTRFNMELLPCNKCPPKVVNARFFTFCAKSSRLQLSFSATRVFSKKYQIRLIFSAKHFPDNLHFSFSISAKPQQGFPVVRSSHLLILTAANMKQLISHVNAFAILSSIFAPQECLQNIETNTQKKT